MTTYKVQPQRCKLVRDGAAFPSPVQSVACFESAAAFFRAYYDREALPHERVVAVFVNGRNEIVSMARVAEGGLHGCALTALDVLRPAIVAGASAILLAHNHPSGCPDPSTEDIAMTRAIAKACDAVGIPLLDHVVVGAGKCTSIRELGGL